MVPGRAETFSELVRRSIHMPVGAMTLLVFVGTWVLVRAATLGVGGWLLQGGIAWVGWLVFMVILQLAAKAPDLMSSQSLAMVPDVMLPASRLWFISLLGAAALIPLGRISSPLASIAVLLLGSVPGPFLALCASRGDPLRSLLDPRTLTEAARALGSDAVRVMVGAALGLAGLGWWWHVSRFGARDLSPFSLMLDTFVVLGLQFGARLLGLLIATRADALGIPFRPDLLVPALPGVRPTGVRKLVPAPEPMPERPRFIEL